MKAALKVKIFLWYLHRGVLLTKDNLAKRNSGKVAKYVFVTKKRQLDTCSLIVVSPKQFGQRFRWPQV